MSEEEIVERLMEFEQLQPGWDSYGAHTITPQALSAAREAVGNVSPIPDHVAPTVSGGVQFEWYSNVRDMELEFHPNGRCSILVTPKFNGVCLWDETIEWSPNARQEETPK